MKAFVLTAGIGSRLRPYTEFLPKPALPLLNIPIVYYSCYLLKQSGVDKMLFNLHHLPDAMKDCVEALPLQNSEISFSYEKEKILGGAGGLCHAWSGEFEKEDSIIYVNGDEIFFPKDPAIIKKLNDNRIETGALASILVKDHPGLGDQFGAVWIDDNSNVMGFGKTPPTNITAPHYSGSKLTPKHFTGYISLDPSIIDELSVDEPNLFYDTFTKLINHKELVRGINVLNCEGDWFEVGNANDFIKASKEVCELLQSGHPYLDSLFESFGQNGLHQITQSEKALIFKHPDTQLPQNIEFEGFVSLSQDFNLSGVTYVKDSVLVSQKADKPLESYDSKIVL